MSSQRPERRLAAILAADVVGFSRLIGEDEEGTLAALKALRREVIAPKVAEHRGRIVKTTGDGLLVEFPSVVDALRCATAWQTDIPKDSRIAWRIGGQCRRHRCRGRRHLRRWRQHRRTAGGAGRTGRHQPSRVSRTIRLAGGSRRPSRTPASSGSRTSAGRCGCTGSGLIAAQSRYRDHRGLPLPKSPRSAYCRSRT